MSMTSLFSYDNQSSSIANNSQPWNTQALNALRSLDILQNVSPYYHVLGIDPIDTKEDKIRLLKVTKLLTVQYL